MKTFQKIENNEGYAYFEYFYLMFITCFHFRKQKECKRFLEKAVSLLYNIGQKLLRRL